MQVTLFWRRKWGAFPLLALFALALYAQNPKQTIRGGNGVTLPPPPPTPAHSVKDEYQGMQIEDPYRWLEDAKAPETRAWIDEQNKYTQQYLDQFTTAIADGRDPDAKELEARITQLEQR